MYIIYVCILHYICLRMTIFISQHVKVPKKVITLNTENHRITEQRVFFLCITIFIERLIHNIDFCLFSNTIEFRCIGHAALTRHCQCIAC